MQSSSRRRVCMYYDSEIGDFVYSKDHFMKPRRIHMTYNLLINYGLHRNMEIFRAPKAPAAEMTPFHSDEYINFLKSVRPDNVKEYGKQLHKFNIGEENPIFDGLFKFCQLSVGGSVAGATKLNKQSFDICINWNGGFHHAHRANASGFCYVNDIVLSILELLKCHKRVLYIDIDVHHADGVERAFFLTDRVMTVSFHKYGNYFPGTGALIDIGEGRGRRYALNIPLRDGMDDDAYESVFAPIIGKVMETFQPGAIVLQCGADSLNGDRLGVFNLTIKGHGKCVEFVKKFNIPLLLVGGGGYTINNVARCWTYETALAIGVEIPNELPYNIYFGSYGPDYKLHISPSSMKNENTQEFLYQVKEIVFENLRELPHVPSVQTQNIPEGATSHEAEDEEDIDMDFRLPQSYRDKRIAAANEYSDSEDEGAGGRRDNSADKVQSKPISILDGAKAEAEIVGDTEAETVGGAEAKNVGAAGAEKVGGAEAEIVGGAEAEIVGGAKAKKKSGTEAEMVGGAEAEKVGDAETEKVSGAKAKKKSGTEAEMVGGAMAKKKSGPEAEKVVGAEAEKVGGAKAKKKSGAETENVGGAEAKKKSGEEAEMVGGAKSKTKSGTDTEMVGGAKAKKKSGAEAEKVVGAEAENVGGSKAKRKSGSEAENVGGAEAEKVVGAEAENVGGSKAKRKSGAVAKKKSATGPHK